jgi:plasmid stability protein
VAVSLKRVNLMLDEELHRKLKMRARKENTSMSDLVRKLLAKELGEERDIHELAARIRRRRKALGKMPDSTAIIRKSRDEGW